MTCETDTIAAGAVVRLTDAIGRGGKLFLVERDGRDLFALRDQSGARKAKRYTLDELQAKRASGLLLVEG